MDAPMGRWTDGAREDAMFFRKKRSKERKRGLLRWFGFGSPAMLLAMVLSYFGIDAPLKFLTGVDQGDPVQAAAQAKKAFDALRSVTGETSAEPPATVRRERPFHHHKENGNSNLESMSSRRVESGPVSDPFDDRPRGGNRQATRPPSGYPSTIRR